MRKSRFFVLPSSNPLVERMLYLTLAVVFVTVFLVVGLLLHQNKQLREIAEGQGTIITANDKSLRCILAFFATPERTEYYLSDLATCSITRIDNGETKKLELPPPPPVDEPKNTSSAPPQSQSVQAPANGGSQQGSPSVSPGNSNNNGGSNGNNNNPPPSPPEQPKPPAEPSIIEQVITTTTDFTCGLVGLLCR